MKIHRLKLLAALLWLCIAFSLLLLDHFLLSNPIGNKDLAPYRLIPPTISSAKKVTQGMKMEEVYFLLGS